MNVIDNDWPEFLSFLYENALEYLKERGFDAHDIESLTNRPAINMDPPESSDELDHLADMPPPAEIVATAWVARTSETLKLVMEDISQTNSAPIDLEDFVFTSRFAYILGVFQVQASRFVLDPGHSLRRVSVTDRGLLSLFKHSIKLAKRESHRQQRQKEGSKKAREATSRIRKQRDKALCATGLKLRAAGIADMHLSRDVSNEWHHTDRWAEYESLEPLEGTKQIREILREGGVLPPLKTKKSKQRPTKPAT